MLRTNLKIAVRNMWKNRFYSFLNIFGLSIGLATCMIIFSYIKKESSFDRFHEDENRIFRLNLDIRIGGRDESLPFTTRRLGPALEKAFPEAVEESLRLETMGNVLVGVEKNGTQSFYPEDRLLYADANFFEFFSFPLVSGEPATILKNPDQAVITEKTAFKYFGPGTKLSSLIGRTLEIGTEKTLYRISGIAADAPANSHLKFDVLLPVGSIWEFDSISWGSNNAYTYVKLKPEVAEDRDRISALEEGIMVLVGKEMEQDFKRFIHKTFKEFLAEGNVYHHNLIPLSSIHLRSGLTEELEPGGNINHLYLFGALALFVILLACVNFINLATARSADRAREVGVRKALGSVNHQLVRQFLLESVLYSLLALLLAFLLADAALPSFNKITGIHLSGLWKDPLLIFVSLIFSILIGLGAGIYPSLYLTHFQPSEVLKGRFSGGFKGGVLRNFLVVFQFSISIALIICTLIVQQQLDFMRNQSLGFRKENVLVLRNTSMLGQQALSFKNKIKSLSNVINASYSNNVPGDIYINSAAFRYGNESPEATMGIVLADADYLSTLGAEMEKGRYLKKDHADSQAIVINKVAAQYLGGEKALNKVVEVYARTNSQFKVVGIMKDFNFFSLQKGIRPMGIIYDQNGDLLNIRLSGDVEKGIAEIEGLWQKVLPGVPFEYSFLDKQFNALYQAEQQMVKVMGLFTILAIVIACLGLFGLAAFTAERRSKEIGIRKVMGATVLEVVFLLSRDFSKLVFISFFIAVPVAYFAMDQWLNNFAYQMSIGPGVFVFSGVLAFIIAWVTVSYQSVKSALASPVERLKEE